MKLASRNFILTALFSLSSVLAQVQVIPQVADGAGWQTTLVLTNITANPDLATLKFHIDTSGGATQSWLPPFQENISLASLKLPAGSTLFLHTPGTAASLSQGWAELDADAGIVGYTIFTNRVPGHPDQDGTAPAVSAASRILVPFDNSSGLVTALALVNPNSAAETISVNMRTTDGTTSTATLPSIPGSGQMAFVMTQQLPVSSGKSGLAEFYTTSGTFSIIALRANPTGAFTAAPVYFETGPPVIATTIAGSTIFAGFSIGKLTSTSGFPTTAADNELMGGQFASYSSTEWNLPFSGPTFGPCSVFDVTYPAGGKDPSYPDSFLDAGVTIPVTGPNLPAGTSLTRIALPTGPIYNLTPASGTLASGGTYTLTGNGGTQVGPFNISATLPSTFQVTNWNSTTVIDRSQPLTINWTGTGFDQVIIHAQGTTFAGSTIHNVTVSCVVASSLGTFAVPVQALSLLPSVPAGSMTGTGQLSVTASTYAGGTASAVSTTATSLTPSLVGGGRVNFGSFAPFLSVAKTLPVL
jgi:hypothetical protein